MPTSN